MRAIPRATGKRILILHETNVTNVVPTAARWLGPSDEVFPITRTTGGASGYVIQPPTRTNARSMGEYCQQTASVLVTNPQTTDVLNRGVM